MMDHKELERQAAKNAPLPDGLAMPEQYLFMALRSLYQTYRLGGLEKVQAKQEKTKIMETYQNFDLQWRIAQHHIRLLRVVQKYEDCIKGSGCDVCQNLYRALCGLISEEETKEHE